MFEFSRLCLFKPSAEGPKPSTFDGNGAPPPRWECAWLAHGSSSVQVSLLKNSRAVVLFLGRCVHVSCFAMAAFSLYLYPSERVPRSSSTIFLMSGVHVARCAR